jgi:tRNA threonylcarbamoyl adenosine modification protein (Sua5/YciO/YrdC/YwlC family)
MPEVLDWRSAADPRPLVHRAARALAEGEVVAFPTDTVYALAASALIPEAVEKLRRSTKRSEERPLTLAVRGAGEALDWVPEMSSLGRRLARRCWPGPVTLVFSGAAEGLVSRLPEPVRRRVCPSGSVGLRAPAHSAILTALQLLPGPLVLSSASPTGAPPATTASAVVEALGEEVPVVIDDGPTPLGRSSTVVRVDGGAWSVLREGPMTADEVGQQTVCLTVFVCTGNTCRSPLAEALFKKKLADRLGCPVEELRQRGFLVISAGLAAMMGSAAADEAVEAARDYGADLSGHQSRSLTPDLAAQADYLVAMTRGHLLALAGGFPDIGVRPRLLSPAGEDVSDPIGCEQNVYRDCAGQIWGCLDHLAADIMN